jgi:hypothetical protein
MPAGDQPVDKHIRHSVLPFYNMHQLGRSKLESEKVFLIVHGTGQTGLPLSNSIANENQLWGPLMLA